MSQAMATAVVSVPEAWANAASLGASRADAVPDVCACACRRPPPSGDHAIGVRPSRSSIWRTSPRRDTAASGFSAASSRRQYRATIRQAFREVSDALVALEQLGVQREASSRVVKANRERLRVTRARFLSGITSYFEVLDAERQLFDSEIALSQVMRDASICGLGQAAPNPIRCVLKYFPHEVQASGSRAST